MTRREPGFSWREGIAVNNAMRFAQGIRTTAAPTIDGVACGGDQRGRALLDELASAA